MIWNVKKSKENATGMHPPKKCADSNAMVLKYVATSSILLSCMWVCRLVYIMKLYSIRGILDSPNIFVIVLVYRACYFFFVHYALKMFPKSVLENFPSTGLKLLET